VHDPIDRALFFNSTYIRIGYGKNTPLWEAKWLHGLPVRILHHKDIAPNLFRTARFKRRFVHTKLHDFNWIRNLKEIDSPLLEEHIILYMALSTVSLAEHKDQIVWRWTKK
jgi:hypothetical protein